MNASAYAKCTTAIAWAREMRLELLHLLVCIGAPARGEIRHRTKQ